MAFWKRLSALEEGEINNQVVEWLSTHPTHETRSVFLEEKLPEVSIVLRFQLIKWYDCH